MNFNRSNINRFKVLKEHKGNINRHLDELRGTGIN